ncbi:MAG: hypothetical protein Q9225_007583 [Loekoesia sp. 1 TL-2023]
MAVPKHEQICPGVCVNIVLKADQRTGKLTSGIVADVLTKGEHPRGIKVRLMDGRIGRVQSLGSPDASVATSKTNSEVSQDPAQCYDLSQDSSRMGSRRRDRLEIHPYSPQPKSLGDYINPSSRRPPHKAAAADVQTKLEIAFPDLDSALIAAILVDYPNMDEAEKVLHTLSSS